MSAWYEYPITHGYSTQYEGPGTDTPHEAYDLGTPFHTPLTAPTSGTVVKADYQSWGGEIFVQPDNKSLPEWYMYHPDEVDVHAGQHVQAGQTIGLSGGENPGYPGAEHPASPEWSTGPHTHVGWWTQWITTPDGVRPYGPEPANLLQMAAHGGGGESNPVPSNVYNAVEPYAQSQHVPDPVWETVAFAESSFNPNAVNSSSGNPAVGLFQLLENAGQGAGYSTAQLQDASTNARVGMPYISSAWHNLQPSFKPNDVGWWQEFAAQSGHPGGSPNDAYTQQVAQQMMQDYQRFAGQGNTTAVLSDSSANGASCQPPAITQPWLWPAYWACQAQATAAGSAQSAVAGLAGWVGASIGPFMLRVGVGLVGAFLIYIGTNETAAALRGESWWQMSQDETRAIPLVGDKVANEEAKVKDAAFGKGKGKSSTKSTKSTRKSSSSKPKTEKAEKATTAKSAGEAAESTGAGAEKAAETAAEVAAV